MKKRQRALAVLTGLGIALSVSGCKKDRTVSYEAPYNLNGCYEEPITHGEQTDHEDLKNRSINVLIDELNTQKKYSIRQSDVGLYIEELGESTSADYEALRKIIESNATGYVSIGLSSYNISLAKLFEGISDVEVSFYEINSLSYDKRRELSEDLKSLKCKINYVIYTGSVDDSMMKIVDTLGEKHGSLDIRCGSTNIDLAKIFDSVSSTSHFSQVYLFSGDIDLSEISSKISADALKIYSNLSMNDALNINPNVKELHIVDDFAPSDGAISSHVVQVNLEEDNKLNKVYISVSRPIIVTFSDRDKEQVVDVSTREIAGEYLDHGFTSLANAVLNIEEDHTSICVSDRIDYYNLDLNTVESYSKDEFTKSNLHYGDSIGEIKSSKKIK